MENKGRILFEKNYLAESFSMFIGAIAISVVWAIMAVSPLRTRWYPASNIMVSAILMGFFFILICRAMSSSFRMLTPFRIYENGISLPKSLFYYICQKKEVFLTFDHIKRVSCGYLFAPPLILNKILIETKNESAIEVPLLLSEKQSVKTINKMKEIFNILSIEFMEYPYFKEKENGDYTPNINKVFFKIFFMGILFSIAVVFILSFQEIFIRKGISPQMIMAVCGIVTLISIFIYFNKLGRKYPLAPIFKAFEQERKTGKKILSDELRLLIERLEEKKR